MPKGTLFTGEFRQKVVEDMLANKLSYREAAEKFVLPSYESIRRWAKIYLSKGVEGLYDGYQVRQGRKSPKPEHPSPISKATEKTLTAEIERLRAENAYLKKLNALVLEEERQNKRRR
jgi:transposase